jgi:hypothetical protein
MVTDRVFGSSKAPVQSCDSQASATQSYAPAAVPLTSISAVTDLLPGGGGFRRGPLDDWMVAVVEPLVDASQVVPGGCATTSAE